ncbi:MAG: M81 family metallopeptidase [Candidatus Nanopelagicales bacterium]|nr:M81 family metallopeptidase [Candidatus Nanopelagicales bacterium]
MTDQAPRPVHGESPRILVGAFSIEANSFVTSETTEEDFRSQIWAVGAHVGRDTSGPANELAGAWDALTEAGMTPVGSIAAISSPGAPVAGEVFERIRRELLHRCAPDISGVYLMLHGSALVTGLDDPEGALLEELRARLGPAVPIAVSLDLHAYVTDLMMANCDVITAYRTCPHVDLYRTGRQAGSLLARTVLGQIRPAAHRVRIPMITPPEHHDSSRDPFRRLQSLCDEAEQAGALAAALLCTQPWLDVPDLGWSVVVTTDADPDVASRWAAKIADESWAARHALASSTAAPLDEAVEAAFLDPGPFVVADMGDATNGGSAGDSTQLLRALLTRQASGQASGPSALSVVDAVAAAQARGSGEGSPVDLVLGSGAPGTYNEATPVSGIVRRTWDGEFAYTHPAAAGVVDSPGAVAVVDVGDITVIVHSRAVRVIDPAIYVAVGVDISAQRVLQAKSHVSYRAGFDPVSSGSVLADTSGPTAANVASLPFTVRPRPLFPFEDFAWSIDT